VLEVTEIVGGSVVTFAFGMGELLLASMTCPLISPVVGFGVGVQVGIGVRVGADVGWVVGTEVSTKLQASVAETTVTMIRMRDQCLLVSFVWVFVFT
jgi:hypothetical protein